MNPTNSHRIIRRPVVETRTGMGKSQLYRGIEAGTFPAPVPIGLDGRGRAVGWLEAEVDAWIEARIAQRDAERAA